MCVPAFGGSIQECVEQLNVYFDTVLKVCRGLQKGWRGLVFQWLVQDATCPNSPSLPAEEFNSTPAAVPVDEILNDFKSASVSTRKGAMEGEVRTSKRARKEKQVFVPTSEPIGSSGSMITHEEAIVKTVKNKIIGSSHGIVFKSVEHDTRDDCTSFPVTAPLAPTSTCTVLICDGCDGEHFMTQVGLTEVPAGDWYCKLCIRERRKKHIRQKLNACSNNDKKRRRGESNNAGGQAKVEHSIIFLSSGAYRARNDHLNSSIGAALPPRKDEAGDLQAERVLDAVQVHQLFLPSLTLLLLFPHSHTYRKSATPPLKPLFAPSAATFIPMSSLPLTEAQTLPPNGTLTK